MSDPPVPAATRLRPPSWRNARLLAGVALVLGSAAVGSLVVARVDDRVPMYAARQALVPGQTLSVDQLTRVDVQLADVADGYLSGGGPPPEGAVVLREVRAGELVPLAALGSAKDAARQPLMLTVEATSASALVVGSVVDVYVNLPSHGSGAEQDFAGAERALERAPVVALPTSGTRLGGGAGATRAVQVMVPDDRVRGLIDQIDQGARITVVPVAGSLRAGS